MCAALRPASEGQRMEGGKRPNILFFFTDDQRSDTIHALGNEQIVTPHMDALVRNGTTFARAHIMGGTCPAVCMPSRAMLMTGRTLFHLEREGQSIPEEHVLLGELLQRAGYSTFGTGKWHNGTSAYTRSFTAGAEIFFGGMDDHWNVPVCHLDPTGQYPEKKRHVSRHGNLYVEHEQVFDHIREGKHSSDLFCDAAIEYLRCYDEDRPFFVYISFMAPHDPRETHRQYHDMYVPDEIALPTNLMPEHPFDNGELWVRDEKLAAWPRTPDEIRRHLSEYYAMITHVDAQMGRVLRVLEETGHAENTIIVFAGDNGLALGQHGLMGKQSMYNHSIHVPLILSGPGIPRGRTSDAFCYLLDIYPTLCDLAGLAIPASVEGCSLVPAMQETRHPVRDTLFFAYRDVQRSVRDERYKLIEYVVQGERKTQFFDLQIDPWELENLAEGRRQPRHLKHLRDELLAWSSNLNDDKGAFWEAYKAHG